MEQFQVLLLILLAALIYPFIWISYNRILTHKRREINSLMGKGNTFQLYLKAFGNQGNNQEGEAGKEATVNRLFYSYYHWHSYILPLIVNIISTTMAAIIILLWLKFDIPYIDKTIVMVVQGWPSAVIAALAGAYLWGILDLLRWYESVDLAPTCFFFVWWRLLIAGVLGYLVSIPFSPDVQPLIGFLIGVFPVDTIVSLAKNLVKKYVTVEDEKEAVQLPNLHVIQGMTKELMISLRDEGIYSTAQLALADPIKLLLRTNLEWKLILDLIDQALLYNYVGEKVDNLRTIGIRGVIEMVVTAETMDTTQKGKAKEIIPLIAEKTGERLDGIYNLLRMLNEDIQVVFIWNLWNEALPETYS